MSSTAFEEIGHSGPSVTSNFRPRSVAFSSAYLVLSRNAGAHQRGSFRISRRALASSWSGAVAPRGARGGAGDLGPAGSPAATAARRIGARPDDEAAG